MSIAPRRLLQAGLTILATIAATFPVWAAAPASAAVADLRINEVESNGGTPGDWIEIYNAGATPMTLDGFVVKDNDDTHASVIPAGTSIPGHGYYLVEEAALGFGLGGADAARLFAADGTTLVDSYAWPAHAATTYGRCPDGSGAFQTTTTVTKGAGNDCSTVVRVNEVESNGGTPGDWIELINAGPVAADLGGYVVKDNDDAHSFAIPAGTVVPAGGYFVAEEAALGFGLGSADSARVFLPDGTTLVDSSSWTSHATTTSGRCPNGTGPFATTAASTKGAANDCVVATAQVHINEVESNGGVPGDWVEIVNVGATPVDLSGWSVLDNDDTHTAVPFPAGTTVSAGGYFIAEEALLGFGLGGADSVRLHDPTHALFETYSWTAHAAVTYGRCPDGTGPLGPNATSTKGAANDCGSPVRINEVESSGGVPGDWVELVNPSTVAVDVSGYVFRDADDAHTYAIPAATTIAPGAYLVLEEAAFGFGLGSADSARLFDATGAAVDAYAWTAHATTTYGRCPNGSGTFTTTSSATSGATNACPGDVTAAPWPGDAGVQTVDVLGAFPSNMSGLVYEGSGGATPGTLWAARNGAGALFRLVFDGTNWVPAAGDWSAGKLLRYPDGTGNPDAEGVTFGGSTSADGIYVSTERNNDVSGVSRNSILRFDPDATGTTLTATHEWNLTGDLPAVGPNLGMEAITWVPDTFLVANGFRDESKGHAYAPAEYPGHGTGLFLVGLEGSGTVYAYALDHVGGGFTRIATIQIPLAGVMDLQFDRDLGELWSVCDDGCLGRSALLRLDPARGTFVVAGLFDRPTGMANLNNEGFAIAAATECVADRKPVFWADDGATDGHAIRRGTLPCTSAGGPVPVIAEFPNAVLPGAMAAVVLGGWLLVRRRRLQPV
jgi:hypothetical protein